VNDDHSPEVWGATGARKRPSLNPSGNHMERGWKFLGCPVWVAERNNWLALNTRRQNRRGAVFGQVVHEILEKRRKRLIAMMKEMNNRSCRGDGGEESASKSPTVGKSRKVKKKGSTWRLGFEPGEGLITRSRKKSSIISRGAA